MNEARLKEAREKAEIFKKLEGKALIRAVCLNIDDSQLIDLWAGHEEFQWIFDKLTAVGKSTSKEVLEQWRKELKEELCLNKTTS